MKHIKEFNIFRNKPKIGDYVICKEGLVNGQITKDGEDADLINFLSNNIGKIIDTNIIIADVNYDYLIKYYNIPKDIYLYFTGNSSFQIACGETRPIPGREDTRAFDLDDIVEFSKNKEEVELYIASKKYNL